MQYIILFQTQLTLTVNFTENSDQMNRKFFSNKKFYFVYHKIMQNLEQGKIRGGRLNQCRAQPVFPVSAIEAEHGPISFILERSHWQTSWQASVRSILKLLIKIWTAGNCWLAWPGGINGRFQILQTGCRASFVGERKTLKNYFVRFFQLKCRLIKIATLRPT